MLNEMHDILFIGDIHGVVDHVFDVVRQRMPKAAVFLGDLEPQADFHDWLAELQTLTTVRLIHGNHDTDTRQNYGDTVDALGFQTVSVGYREIADGQAKIINEPPSNRSPLLRMHATTDEGGMTP